MNSEKHKEHLSEMLKDAVESLSDELLLEALFKRKSNYFDDFFFVISSVSQNEPEKIFGNVEKITGYNASELNNMHGLIGIIEEDDIEKYDKTYLELQGKETGKIKHQFRITHKNGNAVWLEESVIIKKDAGKIIYEKLIRDITPFKETEEKLRENFLKIDKANKVKDKFISIISHDLRAPFTSIIGFAEILINEPNLTEEERLDYLKYIYEAAQTQLTMVNHLLDWSRLQSGKIEVEPARLNVRATVSNAVSSLTGAAVRKEVEIIEKIPGDLYFYADPKLINRVLGNLLSNALKFTPGGKRIFVSANKYGTDKIEVVVKDEGVGIKEEDQRKIFKLEEKITTKGTSGEKGTGLGLLLVKDIVEKHGGEIWFYSKEGEGTEFHFIVPEAKQIFLIIDDDIKTRELLKKHIRNIYPDAEIIEADNGYEALNQAYKKIPSMVITDHDMPLMNGIQFIEVIKKNPQLKNVPILIVSGALDNEAISEYKRLGVNDILEKPFETEKFITLLKMLN